MDYQELIVNKYKYWDLYLHKNQCYIGRCYLWAKREDATDFIETTEEERYEFFFITYNLKKALREAFLPNMFNYASLNNVEKHLHVHVIPRYKIIVPFQGIKFCDERYGKNFAPYNKSFVLQKPVLQAVINKIKSHLL